MNVCRAARAWTPIWGVESRALTFEHDLFRRQLFHDRRDDVGPPRLDVLRDALALDHNALDASVDEPLGEVNQLARIARPKSLQFTGPGVYKLSVVCPPKALSENNIKPTSSRAELNTNLRLGFHPMLAHLLTHSQPVVIRNRQEPARHLHHIEPQPLTPLQILLHRPLPPGRQQMFHPPPRRHIHPVLMRHLDHPAQLRLGQQGERAAGELEAVDVEGHGVEQVGEVARPHGRVVGPAHLGDAAGAGLRGHRVVADEGEAGVGVGQEGVRVGGVLGGAIVGEGTGVEGGRESGGVERGGGEGAGAGAVDEGTEHGWRVVRSHLGK